MKKNWLFAFLAALILNGCTAAFLKIGLKQIGSYDPKVSYSTYTRDSEKVILIPNVHLAVEEQFENLEYRLDSLFNLGYTLYYEGSSGHVNDTITRLKVNKLAGFDLGDGDYKKILDKVIGNSKGDTQKLMMQPKFQLLGADEKNSKNVDMNFKEVVSAYENKYGEIQLNECDFLKFKNPKAKCKPSPKLPSKQTDEFVVDERNKYIISEILKENKNKILMVYGKNHYPGMHKLLIQNGFSIIDSLKQ